MPRNAIKYRDLWVAPGTKLFEALEKKDNKLAAELYRAATSKELEGRGANA